MPLGCFYRGRIDCEAGCIFPDCRDELPPTPTADLTKVLEEKIAWLVDTIQMAEARRDEYGDTSLAVTQDKWLQPLVERNGDELTVTFTNGLTVTVKVLP